MSAVVRTVFVASLCFWMAFASTGVTRSRKGFSRPHSTTLSTGERAQAQREVRLQQQKILERLGLTKPPVILPGHEEFARYVVEMRRSSYSAGEEDAYEDGDNIFIAGISEENCRAQKDCRCFRFDVKSTMESTKTTAIEALLHIGRAASGFRSEIRLFAGDGYGSSLEGYDSSLPIPLRVVPKRGGGFDLRDILLQWIHTASDESSQFVLQIRCSSDCLRQLSPMLEVRTEAQLVGRRRRWSGDECNHGGCCMKTFFFNLSDSQWNRWLLKPDGYYLNYCSGHCQVGHQFDNARDAVSLLTQLVDSKEVFDLPPCCTPTGYRSLKITYTTGFGIFRERTLRDMIVTDCGCRR